MAYQLLAAFRVFPLLVGGHARNRPPLLVSDATRWRTALRPRFKSRAPSVVVQRFFLNRPIFDFTR